MACCVLIRDFRRKLVLALLCLLCLSCSDRQPDVSEAGVTPAKAGARLPSLSASPQQGVLMSWVEPLAGGHVLKFGVYQNGQWSRSGKVAHGNNWFVNWADMPSVVAMDAQFWVAHWLVRQRGGKSYDYDIVTSVSNDAGLTWSQPKSPHQDGVAAEHGFASMFPAGRGAGMVWLDGREYVKAEDKAKYPEKSGHFTLRYARIERDGSIGKETVVDDNTCTCCWTSVAVTPAGAIAAWRGRTDDEIRDNRVAVLRDGAWSAPKPLGEEGWHIAGCPVNGPSIVARGMLVVAAWFTAEGDRPRVRAAFSKDGGQSFGKPIEIDDVSPLGRIGLVWRDDDTAIISWMAAANTSTKKSSLALRAIHPNGSHGPITHVAEVSAGRDTGVPQMMADDKGLMLAWTDPSPNYGIRTAHVSWDSLQSKASSKPMLFAQNALPFIPSICEQSH